MMRNTLQPLNLVQAVYSVALLAVFFLVSLVTAQAATVKLAWDPSTGASGYRVYYGAASQNYTATTPAAPDLINTTACVGTPVICTYTTPDLPAGTYFAVKAFSNGNESGISNEVRSPVGNPPVANFSAAPTSGMVPLDVSFTDQSSSDTTITNRVWDFGDGSPLSNLTNPTHRYTTAGAFTASLIVRDSLGNQSSPKTVPIQATPSSGGILPSPWQSRDIGTVGIAGSTSYESGIENGTFTVKGAGADIWGYNDTFQFVYRQLNGNGTITARVASLTNTTHTAAKAGVMIRENLNGNSKNVMVKVTPGNGIAFQYRTTTGYTLGGSYRANFAPYWVRLTRAGNTFTAYQSPNGSNWTRIDSATISMATSVYVGLAVTSHDISTLCTATINNVSVN